MKEAFENAMIVLSLLGMLLLPYFPLLCWVLCDKYGLLDEQERCMRYVKDKIKSLIQRIKYKMSREHCYEEMEKQGIAVFGMCGGLTGGDRYSGNLQYDCIDCKYYVGFKKEQT